MNHLRKLINAIGTVFPLEHFPVSRDHPVESWQYDGGLDGVVVSVSCYTNMRRVLSARIEIHMPNGDSFDCWSQPLSNIDDQETHQHLLASLNRAKNGQKPF